MAEYDSTADTLKHSLRVGTLMGAVIAELVDRSTKHDVSKTQPPELEIFNEVTPKLKGSTYGSEEYKGFLDAMGEALQHHYAHNRHHPEWHRDGVNGMTLVDLVEMIADWKAATERHDDGDLAKSLEIQRVRFGISDQLLQVLRNTAEHFGWIPRAVCGARGHAPNGDALTCNLAAGHQPANVHCDGLMDCVEFEAETSGIVLSSLADRLSRIASAHSKEVLEGGLTSGNCVECGWAWPCPTWTWAATERDSNAAWDPRDDDPEEGDSRG